MEYIGPLVIKIVSHSDVKGAADYKDLIMVIILIIVLTNSRHLILKLAKQTLNTQKKN